MTTQSISSPRGSSPGAIFANLQREGARWQRLARTLSAWRRRLASRRELAALSPLDLKDIGYPPQAEAEKSKPFWQV